MDIAIQTATVDGSIAEKFEFASEIGATAVNLGTGSYYGGGPELPPDEYLDDSDTQQELHDLTEKHGVDIGLIGVANNPLHPDPDLAERSRSEVEAAIRLAGQLGIDTVSCHSGLPAANPDGTAPNWLTVPIPGEPYLAEGYRYQWEEVTIPYWREAASLAAEHDVDLAIEPHLNTVVHTPDDLLRLREETNERLGAKLDPMHLLLQGIDEREAIRYLGKEGAIHVFEASDAAVYEANTRLNGVFHFPTVGPDIGSERVDRTWEFRAVGNGHDEEYWRNALDTLDIVGFDGVVTVQHLRTPEPVREGFEDAVNLLTEVRPDT